MRFLTDYSETNESGDTKIISSRIEGLSAVALNENKVFIAYGFILGGESYLCGIVCTISGTTITVGKDIELSSTQNSGKAISVLALSENKVFIAHQGGHVNVLNGIVCTISGTTITKGTDTTLLSGTGNVGVVISAVKLDEGRVFIAHSHSTNYYLYGIACTISGTTITKGTDTQLSSIQNSGKVISVAKLDEGKVFIAYPPQSGKYIYGIVCTISGTAITKGTETQINTALTAMKVISAVVLSNNKVLIAHSNGSGYYLYAVVCTILGTTISQGIDTQIPVLKYSGDVMSAVKLNEKTVLIAHSDTDNDKLYGIMCTIFEETITIGADIQLSSTENSGSTISAIALSENNIFIGHSSGSNNYLYGMVLGYLANLVKTITSSTEEIGGVAITSGQAGEMITTVRPDDMMRIKVNATVSTENFGDINWQDVILINRKVFDKENIMYSSTKTLAINGENITFRFGLYPYSNVYKGWQFGWNFSKEVYYTANAKSNYYKYGVALTSKTFITDWWTGVNNTGEHLSATADVTILD